MPLTPQAELFLQTVLQAGLPPVEACTPEQNRAHMSAAVQPVEAVSAVDNRTIVGPESEIPIRIYWPTGSDPDPYGKRPGVVFFHGGGWVVGSIESHDGLCRMLANRAGSVLVSVDYRLAPEHRFPAAAEDAYAATCWTAQNADSLGIDPQRLVVAGDSAGGNLAAAVSLMARDRGFPAIACQTLIYPVTDRNFETASYLAHAEGRFLTRAAMIWFFEQYLGDNQQTDDPYAVPLRAADLAKLPPAVVLHAEFDPLADDATLYAARLAEAGTPVVSLTAPGLLHGFLRRPDFFPEAELMLSELAKNIKQLVDRAKLSTAAEMKP